MGTLSRICAGWQVGLTAAFITSIYYSAPSFMALAIICAIASTASAVCLWRARY